VERGRERRTADTELFAQVSDDAGGIGEIDLAKRAEPGEEIDSLVAASQEHVLAVVEYKAARMVLKRRHPPPQVLLGFQQYDPDPGVGKLAGAADARDPTAYDCNCDRYGRPPLSLDLSRALAAIATFRDLGREMELRKTS